MAKVKKKEKKSKKEKRKEENSTETEEVDTLTAPFVASNDVSVANVSSWSAVFSTAAAVQPVALGGFKEPIGDDDATGVSSLARECLERKSTNTSQYPTTASPCDKSSKRRKLDKEYEQKSREVSSTEEQSNESHTLEGRMLDYQGESILGLVDTVKKIVYSGVERTATGDMIPIASFEENGTVSFFKKDCQLEFPFQTDPDDHCESPAESYRDIDSILKALVTSNREAHQLEIYDPYYCNGSVVRHLSEIGFSNVYNKKEDCYKTWSPQDRTQSYPSFDVLLTNPPYSGDHISRLINHIFSEDFLNSRKPWLLLMPYFVHKKDYYNEALRKSGVKPFYLVPKKRYIYLPPKSFREKKSSDVHKKSSPFPSMWYIWGGCEAVTDSMIRKYQQSNKHNPSCELARSKSALRDLRRKRK